MADEPNDLTIRILREMQATLLNHDLRFEQIENRLREFEQRVDDRFVRLQAQIDHRFDEAGRRMTDVLDTSVNALGSAGHANLRHDNVQRQMAELEIGLRDVKDRVQRLEEKV